jgi:hypothetical protein
VTLALVAALTTPILRGARPFGFLGVVVVVKEEGEEVAMLVAARVSGERRIGVVCVVVGVAVGVGECGAEGEETNTRALVRARSAGVPLAAPAPAIFKEAEAELEAGIAIFAFAVTFRRGGGADSAILPTCLPASYAFSLMCLE